MQDDDGQRGAVAGRGDDGGQLAAALGVVVASLALALALVVMSARGWLAVASARAAADATALAVALDGPATAAPTAAANGATVIAVVERGPCVEVRVQAGRAQARARARRVVGETPLVDAGPGAPSGEECPLAGAFVP